MFLISIQCKNCGWQDCWYESAVNLEDGDDDTAHKALLHAEWCDTNV